VTSPTRRERVPWARIVERAAAIVESYDTGVTLRQLFYRLVSELVIPNTPNAYKELSRHTAAARRDGGFPRLIDQGLSIERPTFFDGPDDALGQLRSWYRRDRTEGQPHALYLGVEKAGMVEQLAAWFGNPRGIPIVALKGYSSQTLVDLVADEIVADGRPAVLLYAGDFDPTGEDVDRDFVERVDAFDDVRRIALNADQVKKYGLPPLPGKETDSRAAAFAARHGQLMQVELDALDPDDLRALYADAIDDYWDDAAFDHVLDCERQERAALALPDTSGGERE
jgi:hypothetical protein